MGQEEPPVLVKNKMPNSEESGDICRKPTGWASSSHGDGHRSSTGWASSSHGMGHRVSTGWASKFHGVGRSFSFFCSDKTGLTGNSKYQHIRTFRGFLVNSYDAIDATLGGRPFLISPLDGSSVFVNESDVFDIPEDVVVVGMENAENFMRIRNQRKLFDVLFPNKRILFVSRYPQNAISDLREWLQRIPNHYVHFGDFDLAGIHIYLSEFYAYLGEKASFLIPDDIEERLKNGNPTLYDQQYARFKDMRVADVRLCPLVDMIHHYRKGYEQEGYILAEL